MSKINEIIASYEFDNSFRLIELMMKEYAEWYAKKCLEIAAKKSLIEREYKNVQYPPEKANCFTDSDIITGDYIYKVDYDSITKIDLPEHE